MWDPLYNYILKYGRRPLNTYERSGSEMLQVKKGEEKTEKCVPLNVLFTKGWSLYIVLKVI